jgi:hypothetical protein
MWIQARVTRFESPMTAPLLQKALWVATVTPFC